MTGDGANPAVAAVDDAARAAGTELGGLDAELSARRAAHAGRAVSSRVRSVGCVRAATTPPQLRTRGSHGVRDSRPGAPLWKVTDFAPDVPEEDRAGLEAALEAAGILDAWVTPDGNLVDGDVTVVSGLAPVPGQSCASVLTPAIDSADPQARLLSDEAVQSVLRAIGLGGTGATWVTTAGSWANGVLRGAWGKDSAGYIGEGAREAARRARIAQLSGELQQERTAIGELDAALDDVAVRRERLADEHRAVPPDAAVREAHTVAAAERRRRGELSEQHAHAVTVREQRQEELTAAVAQAEEFARDVGLPAEPGELAEVKAGVADYRLALAGLWPACRGGAGGRPGRGRSRGGTGRQPGAPGGGGAGRGGGPGGGVGGSGHVRGAPADGRGGGRGAAPAAGEVRRDLDRRGAAEKAARAAEQQALGDRGRAEGDAGGAAGGDRGGRAGAGRRRRRVPLVRRHRAAGRRAPVGRAARRHAAVGGDAGRAAGPGRQRRAGIGGRRGRPWDRIQKRVTEEHKLLADGMARHGHSAGLSLRDGIIVVDVVFQGRSHDIPWLAAALGEETEQRARLLSAREQEILENHLLNEVAGTLHELITAAEAEVRQMNEELESRPTSTGMKLRLIWQQARDAPDGLGRLRHKLRQTIDAWSADDRAAVGAFLQQRIAAEHADNPAAGWTEALTAGAGLPEVA